MANNKQFVVIGLGRFGESVAKTLYSLGHDVLAIDMDEDSVQEISDSVTHAVQMDATDESALKTLGLRNFDVAVVTIGSNIQASVMITLLVKELGVKYIIAKGQSDLHAKVLYKIGADRVVLPEKDMGVRVAHNLVSDNILDHIELDPEYSIVEIVTPTSWVGKTLVDLELRARYEITVLAIKNGKSINVTPAPDEELKAGSILVVIGQSSNISSITSENKDIIRRK